MEGGIDDVGLGVLFGLDKYKYEFAGLLMHAEHLEAVHGVGPHTISVPRIRRASDIDPSVFDIPSVASFDRKPVFSIFLFQIHKKHLIFKTMTDCE